MSSTPSRDSGGAGFSPRGASAPLPPARGPRGLFRSPPRRQRAQAGQSLVLIAVLLAFVLFGFLGFAVDLGRLYLVRGELHTAAEQMALVAGQELVGTNAAADNAGAAIALLQSDGNDNRFNFGGTTIGGGEDAALTSEIEDPELFSTYTDATGGEGGTTAGASDARYVRVGIRADAPLTFWRLLPITGIAGTTSVRTAALAGVSAPLCTVCGLEPLAIVPADFDDTTDFGFVRGTKYTLYSQCTGTPLPPQVTGTSGLIQYTVLNRALEDGSDNDQQLFKIFAAGLPAPAFPVSEESNLACPTISGIETRLGSVSAAACTALTRGPTSRDVLCGLNARFNPTPHASCEPITDVATLILSYTADTNIDQLDDYLDYDGNRRRILTMAVVDNIPFAVAGEMTVLGFRQFLLEPDPDLTELSPSDRWARFTAMYIGYPAPVKQGRFGSCGVVGGPGKVVLH